MWLHIKEQRNSRQVRRRNGLSNQRNQSRIACQDLQSSRRGGYRPRSCESLDERGQQPQLPKVDLVHEVDIAIGENNTAYGNGPGDEKDGCNNSANHWKS